MTTDLQQQIAPLARRRAELHAQRLQLAGAIAGHTSARARALASGTAAEPLASSPELQATRDEHEAVTLAMQQLDAELLPLERELAAAQQLEARGKIEHAYQASHRRALAARDAMRAELHAFLVRWAPLMAEVRATEAASRAAMRQRNLAIGIDPERADEGWHLDRYATPFEANIATSLEVLVRNTPPATLFRPLNPRGTAA